MVDAAIGQLGPVLAGPVLVLPLAAECTPLAMLLAQESKGEGVMLKGGPGANTALFYPIKLVSSENTQ